MNDLRDKIANVDDYFRPFRNYLYWEPHCYDIPICATGRSLFDALDGVDKLSNQFDGITKAIDKLTAVQPEILALIPEQIASQERNKTLVENNYATQQGLTAQSAGGAEELRCDGSGLRRGQGRLDVLPAAGGGSPTASSPAA